MVRRFVCMALTLAFVAVSGCGGSAEQGGGAAYPSKRVTVICPWAAGGGTDRVSRFWADQLQAAFGKPFVVTNRTGGSGATGHSAAAASKADGYTLLMATFELSTMHWMGITDLSYKDYTVLMQINADAAAIIVHRDSPWKTLRDLMDHVKANPGEVKMSGTATGGAWDLARMGMMLEAQIPVDAISWVPTKGSAPSIQQLMGNHIDAVCCSLPEAAAQLESGELRALAVMSDERLESFPDIPTVEESDVNWVAVGWRGLMLPKDTPPDIVQTLTEACEKIAASEEYKAFMAKNGFGITIRGPKAFRQFLADQDQQWKKVIEAAGMAK